MADQGQPGITSPFLDISPEYHVASNSLAFAIRDKYPVSPGHILIVPRRVIPQWWDATTDEQRAILVLVDHVGADLLDDGRRSLLLPGVPRPDGFNVGFNAGEVAGQTVSHLHVHVTPRYCGDMNDPRGGVRHVIPEKGNYLVSALRAVVPRLHDAPARPLRAALIDAASDQRFNTAAFAMSFVMSSGLRVLDPVLDSILQQPDSSVRLLTTDYLGVTEKSALLTLLRAPTSLQHRIPSPGLPRWPHQLPSEGLHPDRFSRFRSRSHLRRLGECQSARTCRWPRVDSREPVTRCHR